MSRTNSRGVKTYTIEFGEPDLEALRNYVHWTPGATIAGCVREAIRAFLDDVEGDMRIIHKRDGELVTKKPGDPYPERPKKDWNSKGGRPPH